MRELFTLKTQSLVIIFLTLFSLLGVFAFFVKNHDNIREFSIFNAEEDLAIKDFVYISGAIVNPGVYEIKPNTRLDSLIKIAGGFRDDANLEYIKKVLNFSEILKDQQKIYIPFIGEEITTFNIVPNNKININKASLEQLITLPGIGEVTAKKIIEARPFNTIEEIKRVSGIGESKYAKIENLITVE